MRLIVCIIGGVFALAAAAASGWAFALSGPGGILQHPLGELWFKLHPGSLNLIQAVIERYIWPPLWDPFIANILLAPAVIAFALPAAVLIVLCYLRRLLGR